MITSRRLALFLMPMALIALILGIITGWERLGIRTTPLLPHAEHGGLMVACFLGGLVMLERAVAVKKLWGYSGSFLCAAGTVLFLAGEPGAASISITVAAFLYILLLFTQQTIQPADGLLIALCGGICLLTGNALLMVRDLYPLSVNWWMGFLLFTILGERIPVPKSFRSIQFFPSIAMITLITGLILPFHGAGAYIFGGSLILLGIWLLFSENYFFHLKRLKRHMNIAKVFAYSWLIITGGLLVTGMTYYDATLHSFFLGFVFSMIFAHGPLMLPRVFRFEGDLYNPVLTWLLIALEVSVILRISGSLTQSNNLVRWGGLMNGSLILIYFITLGVVLLSRRKQLKFIR